MTATPDPETRERLLIALITLAGAAARAWSFGALGLSHFDEGIYAIAGLWSVAPGGLAGLDPGVIPYAPPGFPILVGLAYSLLGVTDGVAILPAAACGVMVIPLTAWVGRRTFGPGAGAAAAVFAALSVAAIAFSRKALTDMPFLACWLVAIATAGRFLERPGLGRAVALGAAVGVAQYFKYNGWLPGVVTMVAALAGAAGHREQRRRAALARTFGFGLLAALIAAALYLPWVVFVEDHGGYAALLRHHRRYVGGIGSWLEHWNAQFAQSHALSGARLLVPACAWLAAWLCVGLVRVRGADRAWWLRDVASIGILCVLGLAAVPNLSWWLGLALCIPLLRAECAARRILGAWWLVVAVITPFYHPYARLWLPVHAAGWVVLAGILTQPRERADGSIRVVRRARQRLRMVAAGCVMMAAIHAGKTQPVAFPLSWIFRPGPSLRDATFAIAPARPSERVRLLVLARRPVAFYLTLGGYEVQLAESAAAFGRPVPQGTRAILDDALLAQEKEPGAARRAVDRVWSVEERFVAPLDPVTLLDVHPNAAFEPHPKRDYALSRLVPVRSSH